MGVPCRNKRRRRTLPALLSVAALGVVAGCHSSANPHANPNFVRTEEQQFLTQLQNTPESARPAFLAQHQNEVIAIYHGPDPAARQKLAALMHT